MPAKFARFAAQLVDCSAMTLCSWQDCNLYLFGEPAYCCDAALLAHDIYIHIGTDSAVLQHKHSWHVFIAADQHDVTNVAYKQQPIIVLCRLADIIDVRQYQLAKCYHAGFSVEQNICFVWHIFCDRSTFSIAAPMSTCMQAGQRHSAPHIYVCKQVSNIVNLTQVHLHNGNTKTPDGPKILILIPTLPFTLTVAGTINTQGTFNVTGLLGWVRAMWRSDLQSCLHPAKLWPKP